MTEPIYGSLEHIMAVSEARQAAWKELGEACQQMGIMITAYDTNETLLWRIGAHLLRTVHDLLTETQR